MRLMDSAAARLELELDAGQETQDLQRQIMEELDHAIKIAGVRRKICSRAQEPARGDKRRSAPARGQARERTEQSDGAQQPGSSTREPGGSGLMREVERAGESLGDPRTSWGQLPQRQREEVIQGVGEKHLQRFREWIERYYRALQEAEESSDR
jgi:hypothetical protein